MTGAIADSGINLRGLSAAVLGSRFVAYMAFDSAEDADKAGKAIAIPCDGRYLRRRHSDRGRARHLGRYIHGGDGHHHI
jgi:hypothetical protein